MIEGINASKVEIKTAFDMGILKGRDDERKLVTGLIASSLAFKSFTERVKLIKLIEKG